LNGSGGTKGGASSTWATVAALLAQLALSCRGAQLPVEGRVRGAVAGASLVSTGIAAGTSSSSSNLDGARGWFRQLAPLVLLLPLIHLVSRASPQHRLSLVTLHCRNVSSGLLRPRGAARRIQQTPRTAGQSKAAGAEAANCRADSGALLSSNASVSLVMWEQRVVSPRPSNSPSRFMQVSNQSGHMRVAATSLLLWAASSRATVHTKRRSSLVLQ